MNKEKKSGWYSDDTIKVAVGFLLLSVCYIIGVSVFISKGDDKLVGAFEAITGLSGLVLSFGTVFFVVKTYSAQKEQIRIQNIQIGIQKQEIEDNKKDVEFNRALDIIYRQLEHTNEKFKFTIDEDSLKKIKNYELFDWFNSVYEIQKIISSLKYESDFYIKLLKKSNLEDADKEYLFKIYTSNIKVEVKEVFHSSLKFIRDFKENDKLEEMFKSHSEYTYNFSYDNSTGEYRYQDEINKEVSLFKSVVRNLKDIDKIFHQYNVWEK